MGYDVGVSSGVELWPRRKSRRETRFSFELQVTGWQPVSTRRVYLVGLVTKHRFLSMSSPPRQLPERNLE